MSETSPPVGMATDSYVEGVRNKAYWRLTQADWRAHRRHLDR